MPETPNIDAKLIITQLDSSQTMPRNKESPYVQIPKKESYATGAIVVS